MLKVSTSLSARTDIVFGDLWVAMCVADLKHHDHVGQTNIQK